MYYIFKSRYLHTDMQTHEYAETILRKRLSWRRAWSQTVKNKQKLHWHTQSIYGKMQKAKVLTSLILGSAER